ncbi:MAG: hypothetical protein J7539_02510 [Niabella sp.]|nr:hypothetical protein [Niabella sp.]
MKKGKIQLVLPTAFVSLIHSLNCYTKIALLKSCLQTNNLVFLVCLKRYKNAKSLYCTTFEAVLVQTPKAILWDNIVYVMIAVKFAHYAKQAW